MLAGLLVLSGTLTRGKGSRGWLSFTDKRTSHRGLTTQQLSLQRVACPFSCPSYESEHHLSTGRNLIHFQSKGNIWNGKRQLSSKCGLDGNHIFVCCLDLSTEKGIPYGVGQRSRAEVPWSRGS